MTEVINAIYARMIATSGVASFLSTYRSQPSLFTSDTVPVDVARPYATIFGPITAVDFDTKTGSAGGTDPEDGIGVIVSFDVTLVADEIQNPLALETAARQTWLGLHRQHRAMAVSGWHCLTVSAMAPVLSPTDDTLNARRVAVALRLRPHAQPSAELDVGPFSEAFSEEFA
jgi:hypothetical protein